MLGLSSSCVQIKEIITKMIQVILQCYIPRSMLYIFLGFGDFAFSSCSAYARDVRDDLRGHAVHHTYVAQNI